MAQHPNGAATRQLWVSIAALTFSVLGGGALGIWWLGGMASELKGATDAIASHSRQLGDLKGTQQQIAIELAELRAAQIETETQFCASDIVRNLMHANELREIAMLHNAVFHTTYPTDNAYYPIICRREIDPKQQNGP